MNSATDGLGEPARGPSLKHRLYSPILKARAKRLGEHIIQSISNCSALLDFGCGDMVLAKFINQRTGKKVVGVDVLNYNVTDLPVVIYDGRALPFENNSFDATMATFALHHCHDVNDLLSELVRVTSKKLIIIEEVYRNWLGKLFLHTHDWIGNHLVHWQIDVPLNFHTMERWAEIFESHNLKVERAVRIHQYPFFNFTHQVLFELSTSGTPACLS